MSYVTTVLLVICLPLAVAGVYTVLTGKNVNINTKAIRITTMIEKK